MPLGSQTFGLVGHAAGVFLVEFTPGFQCPPVRGDVFPAFGGILGGCTSRYPGKNAGGYRSAEAGTVLFRQHLTDLIYRDQGPLRDLSHDFIHFHRCRDNHRACPPSLAHFLGDFNYFGEIFTVCQFFSP